jgi:hypothetical protein
MFQMTVDGVAAIVRPISVIAQSIDVVAGSAIVVSAITAAVITVIVAAGGGGAIDVCPGRACSRATAPSCFR